MSAVRIAEFSIQNDDWSLYMERLEQYFLVHNISNELKVPTLITVMGASSYELLENLCAPAKPSTKTLEEINAIMKQHLQPKRNQLVERYNFRNRKQQNHENISTYVIALKKLSATCEFGETLDENLRDQFVCGIKSMATRQRLFAEKKLTFMQAYNLAASMEVVENDTAMIVKEIVMAKAPVDSLLMMLQQQRMIQKRLQKRLRQRGGMKMGGQFNVVQGDPAKQQN